ncbi:MAG: tRNA lysidine(34) synthetase TilS [Candidatus Aegiribacteria sp.]|nr:tRNA lysidine(34) synthetase TilS [Candidatus Aegiribacteria sp.]
MNKGRNPESTFIETVRTRNLLPKGSRVWAAVSGGSDSVALLRLLMQFANHMKWDVSVLHIDHGTRSDSADDAAFVEELAVRLELPFQLRRISPPESGSLEAYFSRKRKAIYAEIAEGFDLVVTGHTASDRAETLILRLLEGSGLRGLGGMDYFGRGPVIRPLLDLSRHDLQKYLSTIDQSWIEDPTNIEDTFLRNKIRHTIMPALESLSQGCSYALGRSSANLSQWRGVMDNIIEESIKELVSQDKFIVEHYLNYPRAVRLGVLWVLSGRPRGGREEIEKTDRWLSDKKNGFHLLPGGLRITVDKSEVFIERSMKRTEKDQ